MAHSTLNANAALTRNEATTPHKATMVAPGIDSPLELKALNEARHITVRSNDQFNTTVYSYEDRLRGIHGTRDVVLMNENDMVRLEIADGESVDLIGRAGDGIERAVRGFRAVRYDVPPGSCASSYPECNPLLPLWHHAERSHVPAAKSIPIKIRK